MHDRSEIVLDQHDRRRFARDVGVALAHRDADMRGLERGRVVDPVTGHCDDFACRLERLDDPQLLFGHDAREHRHRLQALRQRRVVERRQIVACQHVAFGNAGLARNRARGRRIVAGNHHDADPRTATLGDRVGDTRADRVGKADEAGQRIGIVALGRGPISVFWRRARDGKHADAANRHRLDSGRHRRQSGCRQTTQASDSLGRALGRNRQGIAIRPDVRHRQQIGSQRIGMDQGACGPRRGRRVRRAGAVQRQFHRIGRLGRAGECGGGEEIMIRRADREIGLQCERFARRQPELGQ